MEKIGYTTNLLYQLDEAYNIGLQLSKTELAIERNIKLKKQHKC